MNNLMVVALVISVAAFLAAAGMLAWSSGRDKRQAQREDAVAQAAQDYLARFEIHARIVAVTLPDQRIALMVETPPHKKLRFSHIIEQPIKEFVLKLTNIAVDRLFWRFPIPAQNTQTLDIAYGATTTQGMPQTDSAAIPERAVVTKASVPQEEEDDYFKRQAYQIEEVSWEDFSRAENMIRPPDK